jgi:hypothetical protein
VAANIADSNGVERASSTQDFIHSAGAKTMKVKRNVFKSHLTKAPRQFVD